MHNAKMMDTSEQVAVTVPLKWYEYDQNNSGGGFVQDENLSHHVYIQAPSHDEANDIGELLGMHCFSGECNCCECCGCRWSSAYEYSDVSEDEITDHLLHYAGLDGKKVWFKDLYEGLGIRLHPYKGEVMATQYDDPHLQKYGKLHAIALLSLANAKGD